MNNFANWYYCITTVYYNMGKREQKYEVPYWSLCVEAKNQIDIQI